jgi:hypothetical protein
MFSFFITVLSIWYSKIKVFLAGFTLVGLVDDFNKLVEKIYFVKNINNDGSIHAQRFVCG